MSTDRVAAAEVFDLQSNPRCAVASTSRIGTPTTRSSAAAIDSLRMPTPIPLQTNSMMASGEEASIAGRMAPPATEAAASNTLRIPAPRGRQMSDRSRSEARSTVRPRGRRGEVARGRAAIRDLWASVLAHRPTFAPEPPLPTLVFGDDLALTSTPPRDGAGARAQVVARQADGSWVRIIDQPEFQAPQY